VAPVHETIEEMMNIDDLTPQERSALDVLLPEDKRSGVLRADLAAALRASMRVRVENSRNGTAIIDAMRRDGVTWRDITALTGVPWATARRWHETPHGTEVTPPLGNAS